MWYTYVIKIKNHNEGGNKAMSNISWMDERGVDGSIGYKCLKKRLFYERTDEVTACEWLESKDFALVHSVTGEQLGRCRASYEVYQNEQMEQMANKFIETGLYSFDRYGTMKRGAIAFISLKHSDSFAGGYDKIENYKLFINSHTGHSGNYIINMQQRLMCMNQMPALRGKDGFLSIYHNSNMLPTYSQIEEGFDSSMNVFSKRIRLYNRMMETPISLSKIASVIKTLSPLRFTDEDATEATEISVQKQKELRDFVFDHDIFSYYDVLNSTTEYLQHHSNKAKEKAYSIFDGTINKKINKAWDLFRPAA